MGSGDRWYLLVITFFSVVAFMPWARTVEVGGIVCVGNETGRSNNALLAWHYSPSFTSIKYR